MLQKGPSEHFSLMSDLYPKNVLARMLRIGLLTRKTDIPRYFANVW